MSIDEAEGLDPEVRQAIYKLSRRQIEDLLESVSIQCYDHESTDELRTALMVNVADGTLDEAAIYAALD